MRMIYTAALTPQENSSGYYARIPDVPGCVTTGCDLPETLDNIQDALAGCLCVLEDEHQPLPTPRPPEAFEDEPGVVHALISVDTLKYRMETDTHAVRKNVSLPAWMLRWPISGVSTARRCFRMHFATCSGGRNVDRTNIYKERPSPGRSFGSTGSKRGAGGMEPSDGSAAFSHLAQSK